MNNINNEKRLRIFNIMIGTMIVLFIILATVKFFPLIAKLSNSQTRDIAKEEISNMGVNGILLVVLLQVIQIVIAVIPGQPMEIISGMLYGTFGGMLTCIMGIFIGTAIVFIIVRKVGIRFVELFFKEDSINKIKDSKIYKNPQKFELLMLIIFCIPLIPKDIFIYLGGLSPVRTNRFLAIATFGRIPGLFLTVYAGNRLSEGNIAVVVALTVAIVAIGILGYYLVPKLQNKLEKEA